MRGHTAAGCLPYWPGSSDRRADAAATPGLSQPAAGRKPSGIAEYCTPALMERKRSKQREREG